MGIHDRTYYRDEPGRTGGGYRFRGLSAWSVTTWIIAINVAVFVVDAFLSQHGVPVYRSDQMIAEPTPGATLQAETAYRLPNGQEAPPELVGRAGTQLVRLVVEQTADGSRRVVAQQIYEVRPPLEAFGHFSTYRGFVKLEVWRLVTFQFLHSHQTIWHLVLNMLGLYMFGVLVEEQLGRRKYLAFYLVCGIFGGLVYLLLNLLGAVFHVKLPGLLFEDLRTPLVGASAGVFGVIMACAKIAPNMAVYIIFIPIPLRMRWVAYAWVGLAAVNLLFGRHNQGGDAAHLGGAIAGAYFIRHSHLLQDFFDVFSDSRRAKRPGPKPPKVPREQTRRLRENEEIDAILAKVKEHGLQSLSAREKRALARDTERRRGAGDA